MLKIFRRRRLSCSVITFATVVSALGAAGCHPGGGSGGGPGSYSGPNPVMFVTQVPVSAYTVVTSLFGNHLSTIRAVPRGGDLHILYPDGTLRNLTKEAGFGAQGLQGSSGIAVREPCVHWSGKKALFSMIVGGASAQYQAEATHWQLYEVTGLDAGDTAAIAAVPNQPADYNNISPVYGTDDRVIFTSDRPRRGMASVYPQLDEYESAPTVTGLWRLEPDSGDLIMLNHTASGVFSPLVDSAGRVVFTKWDHLQRDQQADADRRMGGQYGSFNYSDESSSATALGNNDEVFPEPLSPDDPLLGPHEAPHTFNQFFPWMINEDGTGEETVNHVGRHELGGSYVDGAFTDDPNLTYNTPEAYHQNRYYMRGDGGLFHFKEDPTHPGTFYATDAREFGTDGAGAILKLTAGASLDAEQMVITTITDPLARELTDEGAGADPEHPGHFRSPVPLADGKLIAVHTAESRVDQNEGDDLHPSYRYDFRLKSLVQQGKLWVAGDPLTAGIRKDLTYYDPDQLVTVTGNLWELDPVEVAERARPDKRVEALPDPERSVLEKKGVGEDALRKWLRDNGLAIIVSRDVTTRDRADVQQPFNLRVPGGVQTIGKPGKIYDVAYLQLLQGDLIRGYAYAGRRVIAEPMHDPAVRNPPGNGGLQGAVAIGKDGSMAAMVPAERAMTWQLTDGSGKPVVRERNWVSFAAGEIRACPSCHGINSQDQAGHKTPENEPLALGDLLDYWKSTMSQ